MGHLGKQVLKLLGTCSQLPYLINLELVSLSLHLGQKNCQIGWNAVRPNQILRVLTNIELFAQFFTHLVDIFDGFRVLVVDFLGVFKTDCAQDFQLVVCPPFIYFFLIVFQLKVIMVLFVSDAWDRLRILFEALQVCSKMDDATHNLYQYHSDLNRDRVLRLSCKSAFLVRLFAQLD